MHQNDDLPAVEIRNLSKTFGTVTAVQNQSFTIEKGEFISLVGPSGCGKTTLLRMIAGLEDPDCGEIQFNGIKMFSSTRNINTAPEHRKIGMVFQDFALWPHMTVFENVAFPLRARGKTAKLAARVDWALETVHLEGYAKRFPSQLSGGQQQRVALARAIIGNPKLILLDEPLSALDAVLRDQLRELMSTITSKLDLTAIYVTHDQEEALSISDRVCVMNDGMILQTGTPEDIYHRPEYEFVAGFMGTSNYLPNKDGSIRMFRPEALKLTDTKKKDLRFSCETTAVQYHGDRYELSLKTEEGLHWYAYSESRIDPGTRLEVFLHPSSIHSITTGTAAKTEESSTEE